MRYSNHSSKFCVKEGGWCCFSLVTLQIVHVGWLSSWWWALLSTIESPRLKMKVWRLNVEHLSLLVDSKIVLIICLVKLNIHLFRKQTMWDKNWLIFLDFWLKNLPSFEQHTVKLLNFALEINEGPVNVEQKPRLAGVETVVMETG